MNRSQSSNTPEIQLRIAQDQFILEWGRMSSSWGINRTMAQIHALLIATGKPHSMDEIMDRLSISRGNASMNLRDLMDWGIVQRFRRPGDRKDIYVTDADPWMILLKVVRERKRRELDPTTTAIRECLARSPESGASEDAAAFHDRMGRLLALFEVVDRIYSQIFRTDESFQQALELFGAGKLR